MNDRSSSASSNDTQLVNTSFPPTARPLDLLKTVCNEQDAAAVEKQKVTLREKINSNGASTLFYYKRHPESPVVSQLESYSAYICQFLATRKYVKTVKSQYQDNNITGTASKIMPDYTANSIDHLKLNDLTLKNDKINYTFLTGRLIRELNKLADILSITNPNSYYKQAKGYLYGIFNAYKTEIITATELLNNLIFFTMRGDYSSDALNYSLKKVIDKRINYIKVNVLSSVNVAQELTLLTNVKIAIQHLVESDYKFKNKESIISIFEDIDEMNASIPSTIDESDLKKYRMIKGLATSLTTRFIFK